METPQWLWVECLLRHDYKSKLCLWQMGSEASNASPPLAWSIGTASLRTLRGDVSNIHHAAEISLLPSLPYERDLPSRRTHSHILLGLPSRRMQDPGKIEPFLTCSLYHPRRVLLCRLSVGDFVSKEWLTSAIKLFFLLLSFFFFIFKCLGWGDACWEL